MVIERARIVKMAAPTEDIEALLTSVISYGGQIAAVIHNHVLTCNPSAPDVFEGCVITLNGTTSTLMQILGIVGDHVEHGKNIFSKQGLEYAHLLAVECGNTLLNIETVFGIACLDREERKALKKKQKASVIDLTKLCLDEEAFLKAIEKAGRTWERDGVRQSFSRLHLLQLHLLLVCQVVTVGIVSKDV